MPKGSSRYRRLYSRTASLHGNLLHFLPPLPISRTSYSEQEFDFTRAYGILAHAEIEAYCEDVARRKALAAQERFDRRGEVTPILRKLISYFVGKHRRSWSEVTTPTRDVVESAANSYFSTIRDNNGIKRANLHSLFYPIGITDNQMNATWLIAMDSFGYSRGRWAHKTAGTYHPPDPPTLVRAVDQLVGGLLDLDRILGKLR